MNCEQHIPLLQKLTFCCSFTKSPYLAHFEYKSTTYLQIHASKLGPVSYKSTGNFVERSWNPSSGQYWRQIDTKLSHNELNSENIIVGRQHNLLEYKSSC